MELVREGERVALFLEPRDEDGDQPVRRLYWLHVAPVPAGWRAWFDATQVEGWVETAVPSEFPGGDKRKWRLATRYAVVRIRKEPATALGIAAPVLGEVQWERVEA